MAKNLQNLRIVVTRQAEHADQLCKRIAALSGEAICLPLFAIQSLLTETMLQKIKVELKHCKLAIVISRNAAELLLPTLDVAMISATTWACVGPATAECLQSFGIQQVLYPRDAADSKGLLRELERHKIALQEQRIIIFTGERGNSLLSTELQAMGATVSEIDLYCRIAPDIAPSLVQKVLTAKPAIDIMVITCVTSLHNLQKFSNDLKIPIFELPLLVVSPRIQQAALDMGFINVYTINGMDEGSIISGLLEWREQMERR